MTVAQLMRREPSPFPRDRPLRYTGIAFIPVHLHGYRVQICTSALRRVRSHCRFQLLRWIRLPAPSASAASTPADNDALYDAIRCAVCGAHVCGRSVRLAVLSPRFTAVQNLRLYERALTAMPPLATLRLPSPTPHFLMHSVLRGCTAEEGEGAARRSLLTKATTI